MNYKSSLTNILPIHPQSSESTPFSSPQRHSGSPARIRWQLLSAMGSASAPEHPGRADTASFMLQNFQDPVTHLLYSALFSWSIFCTYISIATGTSRCFPQIISLLTIYSVESRVSSPGRFSRAAGYRCRNFACTAG